MAARDVYLTLNKDFCWPSRAKGIIGRDLKFTGYVPHCISGRKSGILVVIDVVKSLHGCDRELIFNVNSQLRSMEIPITSIWKQGTCRKLTLYYTFICSRNTFIWKQNFKTDICKTVEIPAYVTIIRLVNCQLTRGLGTGIIEMICTYSY